VGERLSAPLRISVRPFGRRVRRPSPACAIVAFESGCLHYSPGHSRGQRRGGSTELFAAASFRRSRSGAPLRPAPFRAPRMRTLRGPSRSLKSLHRFVSTSDVPVVTRRHSRVGIRNPPDLLIVVTLLADGDATLTYEPEDFCFARPVRAGRASARERLRSYREPASD
jgi:hypothetical protein